MINEFAIFTGTAKRLSGTETKITHVVGKVSDLACLIVDDMVTTGGTVAEAITALLRAGARPEIIVAATHGLFVGGAREKVSHPAVRHVLVTDTVRVPESSWPELQVISIAPLIAGAVNRLVAVRSANWPERACSAPAQESTRHEH